MSSKQKNGLGGIVIVLLMAAIFLVYQSQTIAGGAKVQMVAQADKALSDAQNLAGKIELEDLRTETSKTYDNGDGTRSTKISQGSLHFKDPLTKKWDDISTNIRKGETLSFGSWKKMLNSELLDENDTETYAFSNEENSLRSYFKTNSTDGNMMRVEVGDSDYIIWQPTAMKWVNENGEEELIDSIKDTPAFEQANKIIYKGIFHNVDEEFVVQAGKVKDNIILNSAPSFPNITGENVSLVIEGELQLAPGVMLFVDGQVKESDFETFSEIYLVNSTGANIAVINAPYFYDATGNRSKAITYQIAYKSALDIYLKIIIARQALLNMPIYPISIDPTITREDFYDSYISSACPSTNFGYEAYYYVGYNDNPVHTCATFYRGTMNSVIGGFSSYSYGSEIFVSGYLYMYVNSSESQGNTESICVYLTAYDWSESGVTYNNPFYYYGSPSSCASVSHSSHWQSWNVGTLLTDTNFRWNRGFAIMTNQTSGDNWTGFESYDNSGSGAPYLYITTWQCAPNSTCCDGSGNYRSNGYTCSDSNSCTIGDYCNGSGSCIPGSYQCTPGSTCCSASGCYLSSSNTCGTKDCDYLDSTCRNYNDVTRYCNGSGSCGDPACSSYSNSSSSTYCGTKDCDTLDTSCRNYNDVSKYCDGSGNCGDPACNSYTNYSQGTDCSGNCSVCDGSGNCSSYPTDDSACGTIDCDGLDTSCRNYNDLTSNRCEGFGDCKDANTGDCSSYTDYSSSTSCGTKDCDYLDNTCTNYADVTKYCNGSGSCGDPSCSSYTYAPSSTDCGTCQTCNGSGSCSSTPSDDSDCGIIDCDGLDTTCANYNDLSSNRCEGFNNCKDANTGDCTNYTPASTGTNCGLCAACNGSGACSNTPADDSNCGTIDCDGLDSVCGNYTDLTSNRCEGLGDCKDANSNDCTIYSPAPSGTNCGLCSACNGSGNCSSVPADDVNCGTIDCDGLDSTCRNYNDLASNRCEGLGDCKDDNSGDCTSFNNASSGTDCGLCSTCNGSGACSSVPADDDGCGIIDCDGLDQTCRDYSDLASSRCAGLNDCKDANSGDCSVYTNALEFTSCGVAGEQCMDGGCISTCAYKITKPNGGNRWKADRRYKITWAKYGPLCGDSTTYVKLQYSTNGGKKWRKIKKMTLNDGVQRWKVPDRATRKALVKVTDYDTPAYFDVSDRKFKILSSSESVSYSSALVEVGSEEAEQASELIADAPDGEDLSPEQLAAEDEDEGESRFGCMVTSGKMDSGEIGSLAAFYGLPLVVAIYLKRRSRSKKCKG